MKERGIIFNTEMVKAILSERKTVTRRPIKPQPESIDHEKHITMPYNGTADFLLKTLKCPFGKVGDRLYVRETVCDPTGEGWPIIYKADAKNGIFEWGINDFGEMVTEKESSFKYKPSIHMPKEYARIWLEITDVRVERVQDITDKESVKEGVNIKYEDMVNPGLKFKDLFREMWESIYPASWNYNIWVWVIEFKRVEK